METAIFLNEHPATLSTNKVTLRDFQQMLSKYEIGDILGKGVEGCVYKARNKKTS
jgi:hypothetical protein